MTEAERLVCVDPQRMLKFLHSDGHLSSDRKARLFRAAVCRGIWRLLPDVRGRKAIEVAESYADGKATWQELDRARSAIRKVSAPQLHAAHSAASAAQHAADFTGHYSAVHSATEKTALNAWYAVRRHAGKGPAVFAAGKEEEARQICLLRDIVGNPLRPLPPPPPSLLEANDHLVVKLAEAAYEERLLPSGELEPVRLAVLADALEEGGGDAALVEHLRGPGPHVRGYHVVDAILGRG
jgi:hypothetical protein